MITLFIPYIDSLYSDFQELKYALRSWEKHCKEPFEVVLVGFKPDWITNITHLPHQRLLDIRENLVADAVSKLSTFLDYFQGTDFVRTYDDIFLLQDLTLDELKEVYGLKHIKGLLQNTWRQQKTRTIQVLGKKFNGYHTESHCPEFFNTNRMRRVIKKYDPFVNRLLTSTLYYLEYETKVELIDKTKVKAGFYGFDSWDSYGLYHSINELTHICEGKKFLNENEQGLDGELKKFISLQYPNKSRFEL